MMFPFGTDERDPALALKWGCFSSRGQTLYISAEDLVNLLVTGLDISDGQVLNKALTDARCIQCLCCAKGIAA